MYKKNISLIVAMSKDRAIGANNDLLWHISSDLKRFKKITTGHTILMGRKTYESLPNGALPQRRNIVISKSISTLPDAEVFTSIEEALVSVQEDEKLFIIGGGQIYKDALPYVETMYLSLVSGDYPQASVFFPKFHWDDWTIEEKETIKESGENSPNYKFYILKRKAI